MNIRDAVREAITAATIETGNQPTAVKVLEVGWVIKEKRIDGIISEPEALPIFKVEFFDRFAR